MVKMNNYKEQILKILLENKSELLSIRNISLLTKLDYKSVYNSVHSLADEKLINLKKTGNSTFCNLSGKFSPLLFQTEYSRTLEFTKKYRGNFKVLKNTLEKLPFPMFVLVFGSYVKGTQNKHSDIDLLIVSDYEKEITEGLSLLPLDLDLNIFTIKEFLDMVSSRNFTVVSEALKKNIILIGIEDYYRILNVK